MDYFNYRNGKLFAENVDINELAEQFDTPLYIYSRKTLERHYHVFSQAFANLDAQICYAVKANSNLAILNLLARLGSGFDIVSGGELERVIAAKGDPQKVIFSGIGKTGAEIKQALEVGIGCFNVESFEELYRINEIAESCQKKAPIAFRINPNIDARSHPYITTGLKTNKFGISSEEAIKGYLQAKKLPYVHIQGLAFHIGSQLLEIKPFEEALEVALKTIDELKQYDVEIKSLDIGGGLGVRYHNETPPSPLEYAQTIQKYLDRRSFKVLLEPGRAIVANAGILITRIQYIKHTPHNNFVIVDAGMTDLLRPALYQAWHDILPVNIHENVKAQTYDVVGPVCESSDFLGKQRILAINNNDLLAIRSAGAYGFSMSSNYNTRPRCAEILVDKDRTYLIRKRELVQEIFANEYLID